MDCIVAPTTKAVHATGNHRGTPGGGVTLEACARCGCSRVDIAGHLWVASERSRECGARMAHCHIVVSLSSGMAAGAVEGP